MAGLYEDEILGAQQSRDLARKLRDTEVPSTGHMIGDWYVAPTVAQQLSAVLKQGIGAYKENQAEDEIKDLRNQRLKDVISAKQGLGIPASQRELEAAGTPAQKPSVFSRIGGALGIIDEPKGTPAVPMQQPPIANFETLTPAQQATAMSTAAGIIPTEAAAYMAIKEHQAVRDAAKQKQLDDIALHKELQTEKLDVQKQMAADRNALLKAIADSRPQPQAPQGSVVEIIDPKDNTKMIKINSITGVPYGYSGAEPKAALRQEKADAAAEKTAKAQENFASELDTIESNYNFLNKHGGITSTKKGPLDNISSYLSDVTGPTLGAMVGSSNQSARDTIAGARSRMIPMFKEATGMSSKQMDSNAELLAAKKTLTDPDAGYEANMKALDALKREYTKRQTSGDIHSQADAILGK